MEEVLASHPDVAECAVFGVADELKGQVPIGFAVLKRGRARSAEVQAELVALVRERIGPVAAFKNAVTVARCPRRARARSCAARCATWPTGASGTCRPRSTIPPSLTRSPGS
jgi:acyl-coenzyme A synthetase/AMP-(fatty) acid ligase